MWPTRGDIGDVHLERGPGEKIIAVVFGVVRSGSLSGNQRSIHLPGIVRLSTSSAPRGQSPLLTAEEREDV